MSSMEQEEKKQKRKRKKQPKCKEGRKKLIKKQYAFKQDGKMVPEEINQVLNRKKPISSWTTCVGQLPNGELDLKNPVQVECLIRSSENEYHYYTGKLEKKSIQHRTVVPWVDYQKLYQDYVEKKSKTLMQRIESQIATPMQNPTSWQFVLPELKQPLSFEDACIFLQACLPLTQSEIFHPGMQVWSHWPKGKHLTSSIMFQQFVANQKNDMSASLLPFQQWNKTPFFTFHGTDKASALLILRNGPNIHIPGQGQRHGPGFYVSTNIEKAMSYVRREGPGEGAIVVLATIKGLHHSRQSSWMGTSDDSSDDEDDKSATPRLTDAQRKQVKLTSQIYEIPDQEYLVIRQNCVVFPLCALVY